MKLILKKFTNNEIKAYPGNCYLLNRTEEMGTKNKKRVNIENRVKIVAERIKLRKV